MNNRTSEMQTQTPTTAVMLNETLNSTLRIHFYNSRHHNSEPFRNIALTLSCLIILTNIFVLTIFQMKKVVLMKSPVNIILCSFTINDAIAGASILFHTIPYYLVDDQKMALIKYKNVLKAGYIISKLCLLSSVGHLVLLSFDRLLAVVSPFKHQVKFTKIYILVCLLTTWVIAIILPVLEYLLFGMIDLKVYTVIIMSCFVLIPLAVLLHQYIMTFLFIRKKIKRSRLRSFREKKNCKKTFILYLLMFLSFFICVVPFACIRIIMAFNSELNEMIPEYMKEIFFLLRFLTSFTNPIIFTIYKTDFQNVIKVIFCCKQKARAELEQTLLKRTNSLRRSAYSSNRLKRGNTV